MEYQFFWRCTLILPIFASILLTLESSRALAQSSWRIKDCKQLNFSLRLGLNDLQTQALCAAGESYDIDILSNGKSTIVMVGEVHVHNKEEYLLGKNLLDAFLFRGLEGFPASSVPLFWYPLKALDIFGQILINGFLVLTFSSDSIDRGSLLDTAIHQGYFTSFNGRDEDLRYNGRYLGKAVLRDVPMRVGSLTEPLNVHLERNSSVALEVEKNCGGTLWLVLAGGKGYGEKCQSSIVDRRNEAMKLAISETLELFPNRGPLLVIAGASHLPGLRKSFKCLDGFAVYRLSRAVSLRYPENPLLKGNLAEDLCL